jgi:hypothetical protein
MKHSRRDFLVRFSAAATLISAGGFEKLLAKELFKVQPRVKLRFIVASDAHYG